MCGKHCFPATCEVKVVSLLSFQACGPLPNGRISSVHVVCRFRNVIGSASCFLGSVGSGSCGGCHNLFSSPISLTISPFCTQSFQFQNNQFLSENILHTISAWRAATTVTRLPIRLHKSTKALQRRSPSRCLVNLGASLM